MSIETKFLIGLFLLMFIGSFMASLYDPSGACGGTSVSDVNDKFMQIGNSFENFNLKSIGAVIYSGGSFLITLVSCIGAMIFWDFCFFNDYGWLRSILIAINCAIFVKILFDLWRAAKPFGG
jgi:hypothetical protein